MTEKETKATTNDEEILKVLAEKSRIEEKHRREKATLIKKIWLSRLQLTRVGGAILVTSALLAMIYAFEAWNPILEIIGIMLFFTGFSLLFSRIGDSIKGDVVGTTIFAPIKVIYSIVKQFDVQGSEIYLPPNKDGEKGKMFLPFNQDDKDIPNFYSENKLIFPGKGLIIPSMGDSLLGLMEEELAIDFSRISTDFLCEYLPPLMTEGLEIADIVTISQESNNFSVKIEGNRFVAVCEEITKSDFDCKKISCPLCGALAGIIAEVTKKPVQMKKEVNLTKASLEIDFQLIS
ncbi:hypothetical protein [Candidatus Borrarchaeum sp.]|uniref:hypothetical protein n=1 Tax=Candidatus Borrarchaeum sp. TaxID=2846742 RepID=UPI00257E1E99|nr:hypothetical protein [Candidatus Borrarchaeum sp.]